MDGKSGHEQGSEEEPPRLPTAPPAQASRVRETEAMKATAANCLPLRRGPGLRAAHLASGCLPDAGKGPWLCGPYTGQSPSVGQLAAFFLLFLNIWVSDLGPPLPQSHPSTSGCVSPPHPTQALWVLAVVVPLTSEKVMPAHDLIAECGQVGTPGHLLNAYFSSPPRGLPGLLSVPCTCLSLTHTHG